MRTIKLTSIKTLDTFTKYGDVFTKVGYYPSTNTYVFKRTSIESGRITCYEVVKPIKEKDSDGSYVEVYPASKYWGSYGLTVDVNKWTDKTIEFLTATDDWTPENRYRFKKTLR